MQYTQNQSAIEEYESAAPVAKYRTSIAKNWFEIELIKLEAYGKSDDFRTRIKVLRGGTLIPGDVDSSGASDQTKRRVQDIAHIFETGFRLAIKAKGQGLI